MSLLILLNRFSSDLRLFSERKIAAAFLILFISLLYSCGLPLYPYLYPPETAYTRDNPETAPENDLFFRNAYENNTAIFSGYELYYKIYDPRSSSSTDYSADKTYISSIQNASYATLTGRGFRRLYFTDDYNQTSEQHSELLPSFKLDNSLIDQDFLIRLKMIQGEPAGSSFFASVWPPDSNVSFENLYSYRWVYNESLNDYYIRYFDIGDFDINDKDLPSTINSTGDYDIYITFYIMSFGRESDNPVKTIYSIPSYLGTLKFNCSLTDNY